MLGCPTVTRSHVLIRIITPAYDRGGPRVVSSTSQRITVTSTDNALSLLRIHGTGFQAGELHALLKRAHQDY